MGKVRAIAALAALAAGLIGGPVALGWLGMNPLVVLDLTVVDDGSALLGALTLVGWLAWASFAASVAAEVVNAVARRPVIRIPLLGGVQALVAGLVVAAFSMLVASPSSPAGTPARPTPVGTTAPSVPSNAAASALPTAGDVAPSYVVQPGDDLWSIAEKLMGNGADWRSLGEANPELLQDPTRNLPPGARLTLPRLARPDPPPRDHQAPAPTRITVAQGDTLSELAQEHLGSAAAWPRIVAANRERIADPDLIRIGWRLVLPARPGAAPQPESARPHRRAEAEPPAASHRMLPDVDADQGQVPAVSSSPATELPAPTSPAGSGTAEVPPSASPAGRPVTELSAAATTAMAADESAGLTAPLVGGLGGLAAAMMLTGVAVRRQVQQRGRALGRRIGPPAPELRRYETALVRTGETDRLRRLERVLRHLGRWFHESGRVPRLQLLTLDENGLAFDWLGEAGPPPVGFAGELGRWTLSDASADSLPDGLGPVPFPALVTLGRSASGAWMMLDLESRGALALAAAPDQRDAVVAAWAVELACSPWAAELDLAVVGGDEAFVAATCPDVSLLSAPVALAALERDAAERGLAFPDADDFARARVDPDASEVTRPRVVLFAEPLPAFAGRLGPVRAERGIAVVLTGGEPASSRWRLDAAPDAAGDPVGELLPDGLTLTPQTIPEHTRRAIAGLNVAAQSTATQPAPWWSHAGPARSLGQLAPAANVRPLPRRLQWAEPVTGGHADAADHPELLLLGPVELVRARGSEPPRARRQCEEYCGWLLENPGRTATQMASELLVAEGTRRSNMSRLRGWLGADPDGNAYLPEAYSGRITLSPLVTSDWQRVQLVLGPGANAVELETLIGVLRLVRGAPLADAAPGQWCWAEELRTDISSAIRDAGVVLAAGARAAGDLDLARWAASRALTAAPEDELLLCERVRTERQAGNRAEVERLVLRLTHHARVLGVDLAPETVRLCQEAMEGRLRARA